MPKIFITGNAGSGKSSLSHRLGNDLNLKIYGLDKIVWQPGWKETPMNIRRAETEKIISNDSWIVDGVSGLVLDQADTTIFLDLPLHKCIYNIISRFIKNGLKTRPDLPENCPEYIGFIKAIKVSFHFHKKIRPTLIEKLKNTNIIHIRKYTDLETRYSSIIQEINNT